MANVSQSSGEIACQSVHERLSDAEARAWSRLLCSHALLTDQLDAQLRRTHGLTLTSFETLLTLEAQGGRSRLGDLAQAAHLSPAGMTRLIDRLAERALVNRERCPGDGRSYFAVLTDEGAQLIAAARTTHVSGIKQRLGSLDPQELNELSEHLHKLIATSRALDKDSSKLADTPA